MSENELGNVLTICSPQQMASALVRAWRELFDETPAKQSVCILLSQWAEETGWGHSCHCWNIGNFKHIPGDGRCFTYFQCNEIINGKRVIFDPTIENDRPYCCFRAYLTPEEGTLDYLASIYKQFREVWPAVLKGNPIEFAHILKLRGYYTAPELTYTTAIVSLFTQFSRLSFSEKDTAKFSEEERAQILALVSLTSRELTP